MGEPTGIIYNKSIDTTLTDAEILKEQEARKKLLIERENELLGKLLLQETNNNDKEEATKVEIDQAASDNDDLEAKPSPTKKARVWVDDDDQLAQNSDENEGQVKLTKNRLSSLKKNKKQVVMSK